MTTRRQHPNECALFALCSYAQRDYLQASAQFKAMHGSSWGDSSLQQWTDFTRKVLHLDVTVPFFKGTGKAPLLWDKERFVFSVWLGGSTHIAYATADNMVEDGIFAEPLPFAQYVRLLGDKGGIVSGYTPAPQKLGETNVP